MPGAFPLWKNTNNPPPKVWQISGITKDSNGNPLANCTVDMFLTATNQFIDSVVSNGSGQYTFNTPGPAENYYLVAYLAGAPDVSGTTANNLTAT